MHKYNITATRVHCFSVVCISGTKRTNDAALNNKWDKTHGISPAALHRFKVMQHPILFPNKIIVFILANFCVFYKKTVIRISLSSPLTFSVHEYKIIWKEQTTDAINTRENAALQYIPNLSTYSAKVWKCILKNINRASDLANYGFIHVFSDSTYLRNLWGGKNLLILLIWLVSEGWGTHPHSAVSFQVRCDVEICSS